MAQREWDTMRRAVLMFIGVVLVLDVAFTVIASLYRPYHAEFRDMFAGAAWFTASFATFFGLRLRNGARDWRSGVEIVAVDLVAITIATALVVAVQSAVAQASVYLFPANSYGWLTFDWHVGALPFFLPPAVYALSALVGYATRRLRFATLAVMPVLMGWYVLANTHNPFGKLLRIPIVANPAVIYAYGSFSTGHPKEFAPLIRAVSWLTQDLAMAILAATALLGCTAAIALWNRTEVPA